MVSLTHEAIVCKNPLVRYRQADMARTASIAAPQWGLAAKISRKEKKRKRFHDKLGITYICHLLEQLRTTFLQCSYQSAREPRVIRLKNRYFCVFLFRKKKNTIAYEIPAIMWDIINEDASPVWVAIDTETKFCTLSQTFPHFICHSWQIRLSEIIVDLKVQC